MLAPGGGPNGAADVRARTLTPDDALLEYLEGHGMSRISRRLASSGAMDVVATAAPGIKDILILGKVKQLERGKAADLIVLDAPAAGHAITFLRSARGLLDAVKVGPINTQAQDVLDMLTDPARCQVILVSLPEETPVNEVVETAYSLEDEVGIMLGPVVMNGLYRDTRRLGPRSRRGGEGSRCVPPSRRGQGVARGSRLPAEAGRAATRATAAARPNACRCPRSACRTCSLPTSARSTSTSWPPRSPRASKSWLPYEGGTVSDLRTLLTSNEIVVCTGSGGVGKTTTAAVLALEAAREGMQACVVTIDPAKRLANAMGLEGLTNTASKVEGDWPGELWALMLDTKSTFDDLVVKHAESDDQARNILSNRFYRNISGALSGTQEYMAMEKLYELHEDGGLRRDRGRHAADPERARLPRGAAPAHPLPRPPPLPRADGPDPRLREGRERGGTGFPAHGLEGGRRRRRARRGHLLPGLRRDGARLP